jgi:DNA-binding GntR family transcriptional regulator
MTLLDAQVALAEAPRRPLRYRRVIDLIDEIIAAGDLQPGSLLPTQKELAARAGVSLITVRRALDELQRSGRVAGHQGVGTFVARPRIVSEPARRGGLLATLGDRGAPRELTPELLEVRAVHPGPATARALDLTADAEAWRIVRLRRIDGRPMVLERAHVPRALAPQLDEHVDELRDSLYSLLARRHGLVDDFEEQYLEVGTASARERRHLGLPPRAQVVRLRGVSYSADELPFDCFEQAYPAQDFAFCFSGRTSRRLVPAGELDVWRETGSEGRGR